MNSLSHWMLALQTEAADAVEVVAGAAHGGALTAFVERIFYVAAAIMFVFGIKMMSSPRTARNGNRVASLGMLLAIIVTLVDHHVIGFGVLAAGILVGAGIGAIAATRVAMTSMPEMVALFNGSGGAASAVVALGEFWRPRPADEALMTDTAVAIGLSLLIGMWTLTGSLVAFGKLRGMTIAGVRISNPITFPAQHLVNFTMIAAALALTLTLGFSPTATWAVVLLLLISLAIGVLFTVPIGGADMPVVVSLLNSYSGIAACATGFVLNNFGLIISGALVGASGLILTMIMCKAMDRSLVNVLAGGFGQDAGGAPGASGPSANVSYRKVDSEEAAMMLEAARNVVIVPGYGMAVAQAQHVVAEMGDLLAARGVNVKYAIHPVAGRMPGHMNVLLAEANVPYEQLHDLELNSEMAQVDVALIIGANDVVNPGARDDPSCAIYGMPIFDVDKAAAVIVCKRSLNPGYAGIENPLFFKENTAMLLGDAKASMTGIVSDLKSR